MNYPNQPPQPNPYPHTQPGQGMRHEQLPMYVAPESWGQQPQQEAVRPATAEHLGNVGMANGFSYKRGDVEGTFNAVSITDNNGNIVGYKKASRMPGVYGHKGQPVNKFEDLTPFEQSVVRAQGPLVKVERAELIARHEAEKANLPAIPPTESLPSQGPVVNGLTAADRAARGAANQIVAQQRMQELQAERAAQEERERRAEVNRQEVAAKMAQFQLQSQRAQQGTRPGNTPKAPEQRAQPQQPAPVNPPRPPRMGAEQIDTTQDVVSAQTTGVIGGPDVPKPQNPWKDIGMPPGLKEAPGTINEVNATKSSVSEPEAEAPAPVFYRAAQAAEPRTPLQPPVVGAQAATKAMGAKEPKPKVSAQKEQRPFVEPAEEEDFSQVSALDALGIDNTAEDFTPQPGRVTKKIHE